MLDFDRETWIYIGLIGFFLFYYFYSSRRAKSERRARKNQSFRRRYLERKKELYKNDDLPADGSRAGRLKDKESRDKRQE